MCEQQGEEIGGFYLWNDLWTALSACEIFKNDTSAHNTNKFSLFHYDGQTPPGPRVTWIRMEHCDSLAGMRGIQESSFEGALRSRWHNFLIEGDYFK